jgi:hypothetical protein
MKRKSNACSLHFDASEFGIHFLERSDYLRIGDNVAARCERTNETLDSSRFRLVGADEGLPTIREIICCV